MGARDGPGGGGVLRRRHVKQVAGLLHDDESVTRLESRGEIRRHAGEAVAAERDGHAGRQLNEALFTHGVAIAQAGRGGRRWFYGPGPCSARP